MQPENWIPEKERPSFFTTDLPEQPHLYAAGAKAA